MPGPPSAKYVVIVPTPLGVQTIAIGNSIDRDAMARLREISRVFPEAQLTATSTGGQVPAQLDHSGMRHPKSMMGQPKNLVGYTLSFSPGPANDRGSRGIFLGTNISQELLNEVNKARKDFPDARLVGHMIYPPGNNDPRGGPQRPPPPPHSGAGPGNVPRWAPNDYLGSGQISGGNPAKGTSARADASPGNPFGRAAGVGRALPNSQFGGGGPIGVPGTHLWEFN